MGGVPTKQQAEYARLFRAAGKATAHGVVDQTAKVQLRYWKAWERFTVPLGVDPFLQGLPTSQRIELLHIFAQHIREGGAGRGHQVRAGSVQDALCAIGKTCELAALDNPIYRCAGAQKYHLKLERQLRAYSRDDPPRTPKLAVPVALPRYLIRQAYRKAKRTPNAKSIANAAKTEAVADLINIAFYYLLRVGEYTHTTSKSRRLTKAFRIQDITLRCKGKAIPLNAPLCMLLQATEATLRITNQKNGIKGQCIHHECTGTSDSPIKSLARRIYHIMHRGGSPTDLLATYFPKKKHPKFISHRTISNAVKTAAGQIGLYSSTAGYTRRDVSSHSLRAGGAMAMHLHNVPRDTIKKQGRWRSETFLMYIHEQISGFATGLSTKMSTDIPFRNVAGPTVLDP